jgi:hypothetical protein
VANPEPSTEDWIDPPGFAEALKLHAVRHGETYWALHRAIVGEGEAFDRKTAQNWAAGTKARRARRVSRRPDRIAPGLVVAAAPQPRVVSRFVDQSRAR